ncbi:MAG: UDP-N-acetylmuramate dehydrogenase [Acidobacteria bacterium]|nr:UDP-N-acetylmuramate dehydrogenase [Acidobacteriota bacterium]
MEQELNIQKNVALAPFTTLGVGGPAHLFTNVDDEFGLMQAFEFAQKNNLEIFVLGGGSNVLISDNGFQGLVIRVGVRGISLSDANEGNVDLTAGAGEIWDDVVRYAVENDLAGIECMSGIPGLVGGTPVQNVGAYGQEVSETVVSVRCYDRRDGAMIELTNAECGFSYRTSIFNTSEKGRYVVLSVVFRLKKGGTPKLAYPELVKELENAERKGVSSDLKAVREAVVKIRRRKSMVIDPDDLNSRSAGSFFKNPIVTEDALNSVRSITPDPPFFPMSDGNVKLPAAWLIEQSGFHKGYIHGNVGISEKHSLAIINRGGATAAEVVGLMTNIKDAVKEKFGVELHPEPVFVGF